jgi:hypothetical protein
MIAPHNQMANERFAQQSIQDARYSSTLDLFQSTFGNGEIESFTPMLLLQLEGAVVGMEWSGMRTLLQRLDEKDPFATTGAATKLNADTTTTSAAQSSMLNGSGGVDTKMTYSPSWKGLMGVNILLIMTWRLHPTLVESIPVWVLH